MYIQLTVTILEHYAGKVQFLAKENLCSCTSETVVLMSSKFFGFKICL